jgi:hypothetical protein
MNPDDRAFDPPPSPPSEEELRAELVRFARRVLRLEEEGRLLSSPADLQTVLGELRRRLFEWEVRRAAELGGQEGISGVGTSEQVVREAQEAEEALRRDLDGPDRPDGTTDPDDGGEAP